MDNNDAPGMIILEVDSGAASTLGIIHVRHGNVCYVEIVGDDEEMKAFLAERVKQRFPMLKVISREPRSEEERGWRNYGIII